MHREKKVVVVVIHLHIDMQLYRLAAIMPSPLLASLYSPHAWRTPTEAHQLDFAASAGVQLTFETR